MTTDTQFDSVAAFTRLLVYGYGDDFQSIDAISETLDGGVSASVVLKEGQRVYISVRTLPAKVKT